MTSDADRSAATAFLERLLRLPLRVWHDAALGCPERLPTLVEQVFAESRDAPDVAWDAWCVRNDLEMALHRFECCEGNQLLRPAGRRARVRAASQHAVLAILLHAAMPAAAVEQCYGGFAQCIPLGELRLP